MPNLKDSGANSKNTPAAHFCSHLLMASEHWPIEHIESALTLAMRIGAAAFPRVQVDGAYFIRSLARLLPERQQWPADLTKWISTLCVADLYLASACLAGDPSALAEFEQQFVAKVPSFLSRQRLDADGVGEAQQRIRAKMLVGTATRPPSLSEYQGRGSLATWVRVAAVRVGLDILEEQNRHHYVEDTVTDSLAAPSGDTEVVYLKTRYQAEFKTALAEAVRLLEPAQRSLLRMSFVGELKTGQIAGLLGVNQSTVVRWLQAAREQLAKATQKILRERLCLSKEEYESMVRLVQSRLQASMERLLEEPENNQLGR